jgi:uncharacterized membrane protein YgdD (TMEM256/DUF423 family)
MRGAFAVVFRVMERQFLVAFGVLGFLGVLLGAFGAHGLRSFLERFGDATQRAAWWETASHYHLSHAIALGVVAFVCSRTDHAAAQIAGYSFVLGIILFCGTLYLMTLTGVRALGAVTPLGGLAFLVGWAAVAIAAAKSM